MFKIRCINFDILWKIFTCVLNTGRCFATGENCDISLPYSSRKDYQIFTLFWSCAVLQFTQELWDMQLICKTKMWNELVALRLKCMWFVCVSNLILNFWCVYGIHVKMRYIDLDYVALYVYFPTGYAWMQAKPYANAIFIHIGAI